VVENEEGMVENDGKKPYLPIQSTVASDNVIEIHRFPLWLGKHMEFSG
jgi:hypothetical protein